MKNKVIVECACGRHIEVSAELKKGKMEIGISEVDEDGEPVNVIHRGPTPLHR